MKKVYIELKNYNKNLITDAIENGVDAFFVNDAKLKEQIEKLAKVDIHLKNKLPANISFFEINSKEDEEKAAKVAGDIELIINTGDWKIIPFENLIAVRDNLFAVVDSLEDAEEACGILEKGVDGVYLSGTDEDETLKILKAVKKKRGKLQLNIGEIISVEKISIGDRICIDTINNMKHGEGMLVGDYSNGMVLVNAETMENPYVASRPFRVNAGAVHCYIMTTGGRTRYLSDLMSGDEVLVVDHKGETYTSIIGRIKQEKRPMLRIKIKGQLKEFSVILQNAETIRVVTPEGKSTSVVQLKAGDKVAIYEEEGGRHFGHKITETIEEK